MKKILAILGAFSLFTTGASSLVSCNSDTIQNQNKKLENKLNNKYFESYNWKNIVLNLRPENWSNKQMFSWFLTYCQSGIMMQNFEWYLKNNSSFTHVLMNVMTSWFSKINGGFAWLNNKDKYQITTLKYINNHEDTLKNVENSFLNWCKGYKTPMLNETNNFYQLNFFYMLNTYKQGSDLIKLYKNDDGTFYFIYSFDIVGLSLDFNFHDKLSLSQINNHGIEKIYFKVNF